MASTKVEVLIRDFTSLSVTPSCCSASTSCSSLTSIGSSKRKEDPYTEMFNVLSGTSLITKKSRKRAMSFEDSSSSSEEEFDYEVNEKIYKRCRRLLMEDLFAIPDVGLDPQQDDFYSPVNTNDDALALTSSCLSDFLSSNDDYFFASIFEMEEERLAQ